MPQQWSYCGLTLNQRYNLPDGIYKLCLDQIKLIILNQLKNQLVLLQSLYHLNNVTSLLYDTAKIVLFLWIQSGNYQIKMMQTSYVITAGI